MFMSLIEIMKKTGKCRIEYSYSKQEYNLPRILCNSIKMINRRVINYGCKKMNDYCKRTVECSILWIGRNIIINRLKSVFNSYDIKELLIKIRSSI